MKTEHAADKLPCDCTIEPNDAMSSSVFWNTFNKVVQCHKCGQVYEPRQYPKPTTGDLRADRDDKARKLAAAQATNERLKSLCHDVRGAVESAVHDRLKPSWLLKFKEIEELTDTTALDAAMEQKRLEIWRDAPNQADIQEAVIAKLDLVHRHAIAAAQQPLVDEIQQAIDILRMQDNAGKGQSHGETTRRAAQALNILDDALAKVKEGK